jgi:hypothetical protein
LVIVSITIGTASARSARELVERPDVHVALERIVRRRVRGLGARQVDRFAAEVLDIGSGGVEVAVVGHDVAALHRAAEEDPLGGAALVGRYDVGEAEHPPHGLVKPEPAPRPRIGLVAGHDRAPLRSAHRRRARVCEQVDEHAVRRQPEQVVPGLGKPPRSLLGCRHLDRFDTLDAEWLDDRAHACSSL